jgi:Amt family ammonium transporter
MSDEFYGIGLDTCQAWDECAAAQSERYLQNREFGPEGESRGYADDATWILTASFVILTMQSGFGLLEAGSCSQGYEVNIMMKNIIDVAFGSLAYYLVGYGISFGTPSIPFMGLGDMPADGGYDEVESGLLYSRYIFQLSFAATSTTIVSGCVAQRLRFFIYVVYSFFAVVFYSFCAHWVFDKGGWLNMMGVHDFAGAGPVHLFGGINGLIGILFVGPRRGRFDGSRPISDFFPSSPLSQCMGLFMLMWGWIGFNCGSTFGITDDKWVVAIRTAVTTINSVVGGAILSIIYSLWRTKGVMVIPEHIINGILASLVSITPACAAVRTFTAFPIGAIGAFVALSANTLICRLKLDDPVGGIGHHGVSAIWGLISVGLFADDRLPGIDVKNGLFYGGGWELLKLQLLEIA